MRYRGWLTICVLTAALFVAAAATAPALALDANKPAANLVKPPAAGKDASKFGPDAGKIPTEQTSGTSTAKGGKATTQGSGKNKVPPPVDMKSEWQLFGVMAVVLAAAWLWMGRGQRKRKAKRQEMLAQLKKGDKIVTIGGIIGTVIEVRSDEVTVKVDETNNVRMKFTRGAISGVGEEAKAAEDNR